MKKSSEDVDTKTPRVERMTISYHSIRPKPKAGDRKCVRGIWYVRQQVRVDKPVFKWVQETDEKGGGS